MNLKEFKQVKSKGGDKKTMKTKIKQEKGITLIALVITIVVLLILAGVSINAIFSENGIINKAKDAQNKMDEAQQKDLNSINELNNWIDSKTNGATGGSTGGNTTGVGDNPSTPNNSNRWKNNVYSRRRLYLQLWSFWLYRWLESIRSRQREASNNVNSRCRNITIVRKRRL